MGNNSTGFIYAYLICRDQVLKDFVVNPITLRKAKIISNFGLSECNRVKNSNHFELPSNQVAL